MTLPRLPVVLASVSLACVFPTSAGLAAEAFFSKDGSTVTMTLSPRGAGLIQVDVASGTITPAPLPKELKGELIESIACGGEDEALFVAKDAVWVWKADATPAVKRVCATAPMVSAALDLTVATAPDTGLTDSLFVSGIQQDNPDQQVLFGRKPGAKTFLPVFCRRVDGVQSGVFSEEGRFFFVSGGDVWEGGIQPDEDASMGRLGTLVAARIAPMGILNTDESNGGSLWVGQIAPVGQWLYLRLRGHHLGAIARIPMPAKPLYSPESEEQPTLQAQINAMKQSLARVEIINNELEDAQAFCATAVDGKPRLFYCSRVDDKGVAMIVTDADAEPKVIGHLPEQEQ